MKSITDIALTSAIGRPRGTIKPLFPTAILGIFLTLFCFQVAVRAGEDKSLSGKNFDLLVVDATPAGVAMAVRAAREGLTVLLVSHTPHLGGMLSNGIGVWDTTYIGARAPIYDELRASILEYYRREYGENSPQYLSANSARGRFEPKVAELLVGRMIDAEKNITVLRGWIPVSLRREERLIKTATLRSMTDGKEIEVRATIFADAGYEGDLLAVAKIPYRVGREARDEYQEPDAGQIFTNIVNAKANPDSVVGKLNLIKYDKTQQVIPGGTGGADAAIQAFNFRVILTNDPSNRLIPQSPPAGYDPAVFLHIKERWTIGTGSMPNNKGNWNAPLLVEGSWAYPEADWKNRAAIATRHRDFALGLMWFLQNDPSVPIEKQTEAQKWGLAKDEFRENGNMPYEMYVRESRRMEGRATFTEHDGLLALGLDRAPIHADSISITEWPLDSHECRLDRMPGSVGDGKVLLTENTVPGQLSYRCLLPKDIDNLLVPMCVSASHIGWGTIRLEPTAMNIGESAGYAAALSRSGKTTPGQLNSDLLLRKLAEKRVMISFFNDMPFDAKDPRIPAVQYMGAKGCFSSYNAFPDKMLSLSTALIWQKIFNRLVAGLEYDPTSLAREILPEDPAAAPLCSKDQFIDLLAESLGPLGRSSPGLKKSKSISRGTNEGIPRADACKLMYDVLADVITYPGNERDQTSSSPFDSKVK